MMHSQWRNALLDPDAPLPEGLRTWNGSDPLPRFNVYRNNVIVSLVDALAETFPVCQALVGEAFFRSMARSYVRESLPSSPVLARYGRDFPEFVESFAPARPVAYLADMARLEWHYLDAHHAADEEPLSAGALHDSLRAARTLHAVRLRCHPSLRVLDSAHAIASLWAAHQGTMDIGSVDPLQGECAWLLRSGITVSVRRAAAAAGRWLGALSGGRSLGDALDAALERDPAFDAAGHLAELLRLGGIVAVNVVMDTSRAHS